MLRVDGMFKEQQGSKPGWSRVSKGEERRDERKEVMGAESLKKL